MPNPATAAPIATVNSASVAQLDAAVAAARRAFDEGPWPRMSPKERSAALHRVADRLEQLHAPLSAALVEEVGTPITLATTLQAQLPVQVLREYADAAADIGVTHLGPHFDPVPSSSYVARRPMGVAAVIAAYNFPILLAIRSAGAALAAGCTVVLLPSPRTPLTTLLLHDIFSDLPPGTVNTVVGGPEIGRHLTTHPGVEKVAFTGSMAVGAQIMRQAADTAKSLSLELGDKSPAVVLPDADLAEQLPGILLGYLANSGQSCGATTRLIVPREKVEEFIAGSQAFIEGVLVGDPWDPATVIGPLIRPEHRDFVRSHVEKAIRNGADVIARGRSVDALPGWYHEPVLLAGVDSRAEIAQQELFGPVAVLLVYDDVEEAVKLANDTPYGLHGKVFTADVRAGLEVAARIRAGSVQVNGGGFRADAPFGGMKASGIGREYGMWGIQEFSEVQHIQWAW
ncbi:betaine-aldehyde dehydrogenase [Mycolicibacterium thermoresistibile ATCC 19527]|uniref:aldehyde dehydrogenase (NAD(+)) n=1 Tax=Mycolicibacterium thermoresistibile (strain ATCC 19527 / DSM 44167 / CIP 105390 / JCM 6362 / NCTC 10409 / 316) TaxID=1078020 RepID=G7CKH1_MYCT3|nr:betaine-aldehyde dehydrogenase [Mycolicibacterium thermoresistibile ATCC 19527]